MIIRPTSMAEAGAQPFASLGELRRENSSLLDSIPVEKPELGENEAKIIYDFVTRVEASGRTLTDEDDRDTAQSLLNYWASRLISSGSALSEKLRSFTLDFPDEGNDHEEIAAMTQMLQSAREAGLRADEIYKKASDEDKRVIRILLGKMIRVSENGSSSPGRPLAESDPVFVKFSSAKQLVTALAASGTVQYDAHEGKGFSLSSNDLLKEWVLLRRVADQRGRIRNTAILWKRSGSSSVLLSKGPLIDEVVEYTDQNEAEKEFIQTSREEIKLSRKRRIIAVAVVTIAILTMILIGVIINIKEIAENSKQLSKKKVELEVKVKELNEALEKQKELTAIAERNLQAANASTEESKKLISRISSIEQLLERSRNELRTFTGPEYGLASGLATPVEPPAPSVARPPTAEHRSSFSGESSARAPHVAPGPSIPLAEMPRVRPKMIEQSREDMPVNVEPKSGRLSGLVGEVFISKDKDEYIQPAQNFINLLIGEGLTMPVRTPQPKVQIPSKTEVRYYDLSFKPEDPDSPASKVARALVAAGIPAEKIRISAVDDATAPKNFIQIALAKDAVPIP